MVVDFGQSLESERQDALEGAEFLADRGCDGLIMMGTALKPADVDRIAELQPRFVVLNRTIARFQEQCFNPDHRAPLTTVLIPWREIATNALHHLLNLCYGSALPVRRDIPPQVLWRASVAEVQPT